MRRFIVFLSSLSVCLLAGIAALPGFADDTEVYKNQVVTDVSSDASRPNILFVLDRSSSMAYYEYDSTGKKLYNGTKRIERLTEALLQVLDDPTMDKANIGLATFSNNIGELTARGAAINFPIADVNSDANAIYGEEETPLPVNQPISDSADDAEESQSGTVVIDSPNLEMVTTLPPNMKKYTVEGFTTSKNPDISSSRINFRANSSDTKLELDAYNVAREMVGNGTKSAGTMCFGFGSSWLGGSKRNKDDSSPIVSWGDGILGLRFPNLSSSQGNSFIPKGVTILDSKIEFNPDSVGANLNLDMLIYGVTNPTPFKIRYGTGYNPSTGKSDGKEHAAVRYNVDTCTDVVPNSYGDWNLKDVQIPPNSQLTTGNWESSKTDESIHWTYDKVGTWLNSSSYSTVDLSSIVQEIVDKNGVSNKDTSSIGFKFIRSGDTSSANDTSSGRRFLELNDLAASPAAALSKMPKLTVTYTPDPPENQKVGLRFQTISIPSGAKIRSAVLQFSSGESKATAANLVIRAEKSGDAQPFEATDNNISSRATSTASVAWTPTEWVKGQTYNSPDLKDVVQEVVSQSGWCGGNSMAFIISSDKTGLRNALSFDYTGATEEEVWSPPTLKIEYELPSSTTKGCSKSLFTTSVKSSLDDAEEELTDQSGSKTGTLYLKDITGSMEMGVYETPRMVGVRFNNIPIAKDSKIAKAQLIFNGKTDTDTTKAANLKISGELSANSASFGTVSADGKSYSGDNGELSKRVKTGAVPWSISASTPWVTGKTYTSPDLTSVVQAIVNQGGWKANNSMSFFIEGSGVRKTFAYENNPLKSVSLRIEVLGPLASSDGSTLTTVRERLKQKVLQMSNGIGGSTNLVPAVYEVAQYYTGAKVSYGQSRYDPAAKDYTYVVNQTKNMTAAAALKRWSDFYADAAKHRVSHPGSQTGGRISTPAGCTSSDPWSPNCAGEKYEGDATYIKPKDAKCAGNYVIFLTDGIATVNGAQSNVQRMIGGSCMTTTSDGGALTKYEQCGPDVVKFLNTKYNITTHTIGFSLGTTYTNAQLDADGNKVKDAKGNIIYTKTWVVDKLVTENNKSAMAYLKEWAKQGKGNFHEASSVSELVTAFTDIVASAIVESTSYAAPSVSVNAFNRISHNNEVYFAIFKPGQTPLWDGNVKKFYVCDGSEGDCTEGDILDKYRKSAVDESTRGITETATSAWSSEPDGMIVTKGGAGGVLNDMISSRKIFTYTGSDSTNAGTNHAIELNTKDNQIIWSNQKLTKQLLLGTPNATDAQVNSAMSDDGRDTLIDWIRGNDRWAFGDPLHSSPVAITFGGTEKDPLTYLFVGTNDGLIRMINAKTGKEEWAFLPPELLSVQATLKENQATGERIYGIDGTPTYWMVDKNSNGVIESGDFVYLYISMRSGGRNIYALDVTTPTSPKFMWVIKGGVGVDNTGKARDATKSCPSGATDCTPGYERLGLTWSSPKPTRVKISNCLNGKSSCVGLVFGGGYNNGAERNDSATYLKSGCTSNIGNAIYIADATTGKLIWSASNSGADLNLSGMSCEIPSDIGMYDDNADGSPDSLYVGDLGGNIWRIDLNNGTASTTTKKSLGAKLAALSDGTVQGKRQFFYPPDIIRVKDTIYSADEDFRLVTITSGTRSNPLNQTIHNQFYALRDRAVDGLNDANNDGAADMDVRGGATTNKFYTLSQTDLQDVTDDVLQTELNAKTQAAQEGKDYSGNYEAKVKELQGKKGWYLNLQDSSTQAWKGEKGLASPVILDGKVFFTTYTPVSEIAVPQGDSCTTTFSDGTSKLYALDIFMGGAAYDFSDAKPGEEAKKVDGKNTFGDAADRSKTIKSGLTTDIQFRIPRNGTARPMTNDPLLGREISVDNPLTPTFWMQDE